ncbi:hypothetical protein GCM10017744_063540 [Streptomyces antimycoticus]
MAESALVLEIEIRGIVEIDMRLRLAVEQQRPAARPVPVRHELGEPPVDGCGDRLGAAPSRRSAPARGSLVRAFRHVSQYAADH